MNTSTSRRIEETPQIEVCERVSGEDCYVAVAYLRDVEEIIDRSMPFRATNTVVIRSAPVPARLVEIGGCKVRCRCRC